MRVSGAAARTVTAVAFAILVLLVLAGLFHGYRERVTIAETRLLVRPELAAYLPSTERIEWIALEELASAGHSLSDHRPGVSRVAEALVIEMPAPAGLDAAALSERIRTRVEKLVQAQRAAEMGLELQKLGLSKASLDEAARALQASTVKLERDGFALRIRPWIKPMDVVALIALLAAIGVLLWPRRGDPGR